ncbi:hypothetical protein E3N88_20355 [Mikania micrantha]|uniref:Uncharacterized protein n=1 Tax=Mikania micrantha TaxID=192012 RepID=A0A5N6NGU5_9ASTR|nr:hypothetical protein E3N88_20355 [Mikania micrantha]
MHNRRGSSSSFSSTGIPIIGGTIVALSLLWVFWPIIGFIFTFPNRTIDFSTGVNNFNLFSGDSAVTGGHGLNLTREPIEPTFYDDPDLTYTINNPIKNWDEKRREWLWLHPSFIPGLEKRVMLVTGSQSNPCWNPIGDHLLLRFLKNKVDFCRIQGSDIFYSNVLFHPKMSTYRARIPWIRAAMLAHPEAEWIFWVDSDVVFTNMDFKLPFQRYKNHNFVVHGWPESIYKKKSWKGLNDGVFLIRNSQWAFDFMDVWSGIGPNSPKYKKRGGSDDQTGLIYLLLKEKEKWEDKIYVEAGYYLEGKWMEVMGKLENLTEKYNGVEKGVRRLRKRHGEKVRGYSALWEEYLESDGLTRPFVVDFRGCHPCSGRNNKLYSSQICLDAMEVALNFGDNQVLRSYGFVHSSLGDSSSVLPLAFDYPA